MSADEKIVYIDNGCIVLDVKGRLKYDIDLDRIRTQEDILGWIAQLSGKNWFTSEYLWHFLNTIDSVTGLVSKARERENR